MSKNSQVYYAVGRGKEVGIYGSWKECQSQIEGISNAKYRKFFSIQEAQEFVDFWKNYSSPKSDRSESPSLVSTHRNRGGFHFNRTKNYSYGKLRPNHLSHLSQKNWGGFHSGGKRSQWENNRRQTSFSNQDSPAFFRRSDLLLGIKENMEEKTVKPLPPYYISPISSLKTSPFYLKNVEKKTKNNSQKSVECIEITDNINRSNAVDDICTLKSDIQFELPCDTPQTTSCLSCENVSVESESINPLSENFSDRVVKNENEVEVIGIKSNNETVSQNAEVEVINNEIIQIETNNETVRQKAEVEVINNETTQIEANNETISQGVEEEINDKLKTCVRLLESALKLIANQNSTSSESMKQTLKLFLQTVIPGTNLNINPQMDVEESTTKKEVTPNEPADCDSSASEPQQQQQQKQQAPPTQPSPSKVSQESSVNHSSIIEGKMEQKNVDVLALTLRLDAFERRFDSCLKEMGAITSEISHIKSEIKEMREGMGSGYGSPGKKGLQQTTLKFGSPNKLEFSSPSRSYSSYKAETSSEEPEAKRGRSLKRKLSRSDSTGENEAFEEILSKIKMEEVDYTSFSIDKDSYIEVYTDGACHSNGKRGAKAGIGVWWGDNHPLNVSEPVDGSATNNSAEIQAARIAIELAIKAGLTKLKICTDSEFLINCITKWIHRWKKNNWTLVDGGKVKNKKEFEKLDKVASKINVRWEKVEAHVGIHGNEMADRLANEGAEKYRR